MGSAIAKAGTAAELARVGSAYASVDTGTHAACAQFLDSRKRLTLCFLACQFGGVNGGEAPSSPPGFVVDRNITSVRSSFLGLGLGSNATSGLGELEKFSQGLLPLVVGDKSLLLDDLGDVVNITSKVLRGDGGVGHRVGISLGDIVLRLSLDVHGESS